MKNICLLLFVLLCATSYSQIVNIPDPNFLDALVNWPVSDTNNDGNPDSDVDLNDDGQIQVIEAEVVTFLFLPNFNIESLEGIEDFINLEMLTINSNLIFSLDLSQNINLTYLNCRGNLLTELNLTNNTLLEGLYCSHNEITELNLSTNNLLTNLDCSENLISDLLITSPEIYYLNCSNNSLQSLDLSANTNLYELHCRYNHDLVDIDFSNNISLNELLINYTGIVNLDLSNNINLTHLNCSDNYSLEYLNIKNGNNTSLQIMLAPYTLLGCVEVDDIDYANNAPWIIPEDGYYSEDCSLSTFDFENTSFKFSPNPVTDYIYIKSDIDFDKVQIYSLKGELVRQTLNTQINVSGLSKGVYFVSISKGKQTITKKLIKS